MHTAIYTFITALIHSIENIIYLKRMEVLDIVT